MSEYFAGLPEHHQGFAGKREAPSPDPRATAVAEQIVAVRVVGVSYEAIVAKYAALISAALADAKREALEEQLADAWYAGRKSTQDLSNETATGPQLQQACRAYLDSALKRSKS